MARRSRRSLDFPESLGAVLDRAGENRFARDDGPFPRWVWAKAVGPRIAERTQPMKLDRGVLHVRAATSVWANELSMLGPDIVSRLRAQRIVVSDLRFSVGPVATFHPAVQTRPSKKVPPPAPLPPEMALHLAQVDDPDLSQAIAEAASLHLAWQEHVTAQVSATPRAARAPRDAGGESDPWVPRSRTDPEGTPNKPATSPGRRH